jgi:hypothetical protein
MKETIKEQHAWDDLLDLSLIGQTFNLNGDVYKFSKFMVRAKANPVVAICISDGTTHRFDAVQVARAFGKAAWTVAGCGIGVKSGKAGEVKTDAS